MNDYLRNLQKQPTLLVMAGGTGGHIFPALAVAKHLERLGWNIIWLGNPGSMEARLVPQHGYEMRWMRFGALRGKGWVRKLLLPFNLLKGFWQAIQVLREIKPDVVLGMGGYVTFPAGMMAALLGYPLVIHEQNSIAGLANRVLAKVADRVLTGFPKALPEATWVGNPVRQEIAHLPPPEDRLEGREGPLRLLVVGGSLGAQALNEAIPAGVALIPRESRPEILHQSGESHLEFLKRQYAEAGVEAQCVAFIDDMAATYAWADLVICRAGALTVAELTCGGLPAVLVPYPHAVDDHQTENARFLVNSGGAFLMHQKNLTPEAIAHLGRYSREQLLQMAQRAFTLAKPDATRAVAEVCLELKK